MWSIVARYMTLGEAEAARSALDAAGIDCHVGDENMIAVDWMYSNAIGGVKLLVRDEDLDAAAEVLASEAEEAPAAAEAIEPEAVVHDETAMQCPSCGSADIQHIPRLLLFCAFSVIALGLGVAIGQPAVILAAVLAFGLIALVSPSHRCRNCGERWTADDAPVLDLHAPPPNAADAADLVCPRCHQPELHRVLYRRLAVVPLIAFPVMFLVLPIWLLLPGWKCDNCGRRVWFR